MAIKTVHNNKQIHTIGSKYIHIHIQFICILLCPRVYTQSFIYKPNWYSMCLLIMWGFSLLILQNSGKVIKFKGHFYFKRTML